MGLYGYEIGGGGFLIILGIRNLIGINGKSLIEMWIGGRYVEERCWVYVWVRCRGCAVRGGVGGGYFRGGYFRNFLSFLIFLDRCDIVVFSFFFSLF